MIKKIIFLVVFLAIVVAATFLIINYDFTAKADEKEFKIKNDTVYMREIGSDAPFVKRDAKWAHPILGKPGLDNLFKVDEDIYRGAQPTVEGFKELKKMSF